jgi:hypothetical protein
MGERLTLSAPTPPRPGISEYRGGTFLLDDIHGVVRVMLIADNGEVFRHEYNKVITTAAGETGQQLINKLNKANLSAPGGTLKARVFQQLIADGLIAGTVGGSPD